MKDKKARITCCADCPHLDNSYYDYLGECYLLNNKKISKEISVNVDIHPECPLEDFEEDKSELDKLWEKNR